MSKKDIVKYIIDEYGVTSPTDITNALKDLLGETLQEMMDAEFNAHMGLLICILFAKERAITFLNEFMLRKFNILGILIIK